MYLNLNEDRLKQQNAFETAREITQQPSTWLKSVKIIQTLKPQIKAFLAQAALDGEFDVVFLGAGTSEYVGNVLALALNPSHNFTLRSVSSTEMVMTPRSYINPNKHTVFISFGRSGNSPESLGAVQAVEAVCSKSHHVFITCNKNGKLAQLVSSMDNALAIVLPDETHDLGFAMTSSFTSMLLSAYLVLNLDQLDDKVQLVDVLSANVASQLTSIATSVQSIIDAYDFKRIIYLGSHLMRAYTQESALKVLELTAGKIPTMYESPMGFRHGPKSFIDETALIVVYLNDEPLIRKYELDLIAELQRQQKGYKILLVSHQPVDLKTDYAIMLPYDAKLPMVLVGLEMMMVAHCIGFLKSFSMGLTTDNPCPTGEINRVVTGVTLYPVKE
jgi:tagatose-6-phosphate ketose/aldose isomerase